MKCNRHKLEMFTAQYSVLSIDFGKVVKKGPPSRIRSSSPLYPGLYPKILRSALRRSRLYEHIFYGPVLIYAFYPSEYLS